MGLESATYVNDLTTTNPTASDKRSQGDDHLRLIKSVLKATFPDADHAIYIDQDYVALASAATVNIGAAASRAVNITGTTTITAFDTVAAGLWRWVRFDGALTLTHNATTLILPGNANITTAAGDCALFRSEGSGNWRCLSYMKRSGLPIVTTGLDADTVDGSHLVDFDPRGQHTVFLDCTYFVPEDGAAGPTVATVAGTNQDYKELLFDGASTETAFAKIQVPKGIDVAAAIVAEVAYAPKGTSSGNVRWSISMLATGDGDTPDSAFGTAVADDSAAGATANVEQRSGEMSVTPGGTLAAQDTLWIKLQRLGGHANDTNTGDVGLYGVRLHLTMAEPTDD